MVGALPPRHHTQAEIHADALTMALPTLGLIQLLHAFLTLNQCINQSLKLVSLETRLSTGQFQVAFVLLMATIVVPGFNSLSMCHTLV